MENSIIKNLVKNIGHLLFVKYKGNLSEFGRDIKVPQSTLFRLLNEEMPDPKYSLIRAVANGLDVGIVDLVEGDMINKTSPKKILRAQYISVLNGDKGYVKAVSNDKEAYAIHCDGTDLMPRIKAGEFIIIEPNTEFQPGDEVYITLQNGDERVETFLYDSAGLMTFMSINETPPPLRLSRNDIQAIHYIAGIAKPALWTKTI